MKKQITIAIITIVMIAVGSIEMCAQRVYIPYRSQLGYGIEAGVNISRTGTNPSGKTEQIGFNAGILIDYTLMYEHGLYVESGLKLTSKGLKGKLDKHNQDIDMDAIYVQVPLYIRYTYEFSTMNVFLKTGPFVALGVLGKTKYNNISTTGERTEYKENTFGDKGIAKRWDTGWAAGAGIEIGQVMLSIVGEHGFLRATPMGKGRTRNISASIGYSFK